MQEPILVFGNAMSNGFAGSYLSHDLEQTPLTSHLFMVSLQNALCTTLSDNNQEGNAAE
jgi:hypothetical protein